MWRFPEIGFSLIKHPFLGTPIPMTMETSKKNMSSTRAMIVPLLQQHHRPTMAPCGTNPWPLSGSAKPTLWWATGRWPRFPSSEHSAGLVGVLIYKLGLYNMKKQEHPHKSSKASAYS